MNTRALPLLLSVTLATLVLAGCSQRANPAGIAAGASKQTMRARSGTDEPLPFHASAKKAIEIINTTPGFKNSRLVSIEAKGLDQFGRMVPLLGSYWVFKFWTNVTDDDGKVASETTRVDVVLHIEGHHDVVADGETKQVPLERVLDPERLAPPTKIVPFAIALGLVVNPAGPAFNNYDVVYNSWYANPSAAKTDVADVMSYYQREVYDKGIHIPARPELLPDSPPAPGGAVPPVPGVSKMTAQELAQANAKRKRQHI